MEGCKVSEVCTGRRAGHCNLVDVDEVLRSGIGQKGVQLLRDEGEEVFDVGKLIMCSSGGKKGVVW